MENNNLKPVLYDKNKKMTRYNKNKYRQKTNGQYRQQNDTSYRKYTSYDREYTRYGSASNSGQQEFQEKNQSKNNPSYKLNWIEKFFLYIAGVDINLIRHCPKNDVIRHTFIGMLLFIFFFYALFNIYHVFHTSTIFDGYTVLVYSFIVALFIFMIDRFIINSFILDPKHSFWSKLFNPYTFIRLFLAFCIGLFISIPMLMQLYSDAIENQHKQNLEKKLEQIQNHNFQNSVMEEAIQNINQRLNSYKSKRMQLLQESDSLEKVYKKNIVRYFDNEKNEYVWRLNQIGSIAKNRFLDLQNIEIPEIDNRIKQLELQRDSAMQAKLEDSQNRQNQSKEVNKSLKFGFVEKFKILTGLMFADKYQTTLSILLLLFFMSLELVPVLIKLIAPPTQYDIIIYENYQHKLKESENTLLHYHLFLEHRIYEHQKRQEKEKEQLNMEMEIENKKLRNRLSELEHEILKIQIHNETDLELLKTQKELEKLQAKKDLLFAMAGLFEAEKTKLMSDQEMEKLKLQHQLEIERLNIIHKLNIEKMKKLQDLELDKIKHKQNLEKIKDSEIQEATIKNVLNIINEISANLEKNIQSSGKIDVYDI